MNLNKQTKKQSGFTIIEVMIVLAVAGLIMAIVFLAIPALQRSNRNTQRKNDATRLAGLVAEYQSNQNGKLPPDIATLGTITWSSFDSTNVTLVTQASPGTDPTTDQMKLVTGAICNGNTLDKTNKGTSRQVVVWWGIEPSGTQCVQQ